MTKWLVSVEIDTAPDVQEVDVITRVDNAIAQTLMNGDIIEGWAGPIIERLPDNGTEPGDLTAPNLRGLSTMLLRG